MRVRTDSEAGRQPRHFMPLHKQNKQKDSKKRIPDSQQDILGLETKVPKTSSKNRSRSPLSSLSPLSPLGLTWLTGDGIGGQTCDQSSYPVPKSPQAFGWPSRISRFGFQNSAGSGRICYDNDNLCEYLCYILLHATIMQLSCLIMLESEMFSTLYFCVSIRFTWSFWCPSQGVLVNSRCQDPMKHLRHVTRIYKIIKHQDKHSRHKVVIENLRRSQKQLGE